MSNLSSSSSSSRSRSISASSRSHPQRSAQSSMVSPRMGNVAGANPRANPRANPISETVQKPQIHSSPALRSSSRSRSIPRSRSRMQSTPKKEPLASDSLMVDQLEKRRRDLIQACRAPGSINKKVNTTNVLTPPDDVSVTKRFGAEFSSPINILNHLESS